MKASSSRDVRSKMPSSGQLQAQAERSLSFLQLIERTITMAVANTRLLETVTQELVTLQKTLEGARPSTPLDPEGTFSRSMRISAEVAQRMYDYIAERRSRARADKRLTEEDGVDDCYSGLLTALANYHNLVEDVRDTVETLDSLLSKPVGRFTSPEELMKGLA